MFSPIGGNRSQLRALFVILPLSLFLICALLIGMMPLASSTEAREAHIISLLTSGADWVLPLRNGIVPSKPLFYHWVGALLSVNLGDSIVVARLPSVLFGVGTLILTVFMGLSLFKPKDAQEKALQVLVTSLVLVSTWGFLGLMLEARVDMTFTFWCTLAVHTIFRRYQPGFLARAEGLLPSTSTDFFWFYVCAGIAVLARGPIGLALPLLVTFSASTYISGVRLAAKSFLRPRLGWLMFLLLVIPWYALAALKGSESFIWRQLVFENLLRISGGAHVNTEAFWFYLPSFLRSAFPWSVIFVLGVLRSIRDRPKVLRLDGQERIRDLAVIWFVVGFIFFSIASGKRHSYLLPLLPAVAMYVGSLLSVWIVSLSQTKRVILEAVFLKAKWEWLIIFMFTAAEALRLPITVKSAMQYELLNWVRGELWLVEITLVLTLSLSLIWRALVGHRCWEGAFSNWLCFVSCVLVIACTAVGAKNSLKGYPQFAIELAAVVDLAQVEIVKNRFDESFDPLMYYLRRPIDVLNLESNRLGSYMQQGRYYKLIRRELVESWQRENMDLANQLERVREFSVSSKRFTDDDQAEFELVRLLKNH